MRVLYVITELHEGGAENALFEVAVQVAGAGHSVCVVALHGGNGAVGARLSARGIPCHDMGLDRASRAGRLLSLRAEARRFGPDVVHAWLFHASLAARLVVPRAFPLIASLRVVEPRPLHVWLDRVTRRRVDRYLCVSRRVMRFATERVRAKPAWCEVIENGVDYDAFEPARISERLPGPFRGLSVGRVTAQKGFDILLEALGQLKRKGCDLHWRFVGPHTDARLAKRLHLRTGELGLEHVVSWPGSLPRDDMVECYANADALALPSRWEGQPNVVLEAMAAGLPVLCSRADGIDDLLATVPGCALTVEPNSADAWADSLARVSTQRVDLTSYQVAGQRLAEQRNWTRVARQHVSAYERTLEIRPPGS